MRQPAFFLGHAGTGKTRQLLEAIRECHEHHLQSQHQRVLALSVMRGAIRRLEEKFSQDCRNVPSEIRTIDSFALTIVNRWRAALGYQQPIVPTSADDDFQGPFHSHITFASVCEKAAALLSNSTISNLIGFSYPLIVIDEFQDCHGSKLDFVKELAKCSYLFAAADEFQLLDDDIDGCPSVEWISEAQQSGAMVTTLAGSALTGSHRCNIRSIMNAARCLRENVQSSEKTIPVYCCPRIVMAATKLTVHKPAGHLALISPTRKSILSILKAHDLRLVEKGWPPVYWRRESSRSDETTQILKELALDDDGGEPWSGPPPKLSVRAQTTAEFILRSMKLRGLSESPKSFARSLAEKFTSDRGAWARGAVKRQALTVHGAKNREFDNVVVLWDPHRLTKWSNEKRRRSLYNAVTRARRSCVVLYLGDERTCKADPIVSLLGPAEPAFSRRKKKSSG